VDLFFFIRGFIFATGKTHALVLSLRGDAMTSFLKKGDNLIKGR
jgi:hypothetical protein